MKPKHEINWKPLIVIISAFALIYLIYNSGLIFNITGSMPIGIYYTSSNTKNIKKGDFVIVKLPFQLQKFGVERKYIPNYKTKLLKEVIGIPGDKVNLKDKEIVINNSHVYKAPTYKYDMEHRKLHFYPRGEYISKSYWLYGENNPDESWDSRYYGPVNKLNILKKAVPVITI